MTFINVRYLNVQLFWWVCHIFPLIFHYINSTSRVQFLIICYFHGILCFRTLILIIPNLITIFFHLFFSKYPLALCSHAPNLHFCPTHFLSWFDFLLTLIWSTNIHLSTLNLTFPIFRCVLRRTRSVDPFPLIIHFFTGVHLLNAQILSYFQSNININLHTQFSFFHSFVLNQLVFSKYYQSFN